MTNLSLLSGGIAGWWASIEDAMAEATTNTIIGITVVFAALLFICFVISLFKYVNLFEQKLAAKKAAQSPAPKAVQPDPVSVSVAEPEPEMDDLELIAVITAAIHAYEEAQGNTVVEGDLVVRSIKKRNSRWQNA
ncbi:MAG: OadG family protein [Lachnospiraceae bacterium]|nr:OadG family protein [Lachnospiraceae bacterium]